MQSKLLQYGSLLILLFVAGCDSAPQISEADQPTEVIKLTQTGCQFLETESEDFKFKTTQADDCKEVNANTLEKRKAGFKPLALKPGKYIFEVTNRDVPYALGFYLRGEGFNQVTLPKVSGGDLNQGQTQSYEITLKPGNYVFSCPLNPTPDYPVIVQ
ncbi:hypothetical protein [Acaryochloris sp. IP29b_bin.148]|uniref:hypothetical protein n=1 Tax=Acaryochloris sp. IP29b_bin.148 TaxID=2969218 RepID=UPI0026083DD8|nr:hypothetical protein [Acaryochloris sp. IP29b_bin.148]